MEYFVLYHFNKYYNIIIIFIMNIKKLYKIEHDKTNNLLLNQFGLEWINDNTSRSTSKFFVLFVLLN